MHCTIVEENTYVIELHELMKEYPRVEDVNDGIKWALSRGPAERGEPIQPGACVYVYNTLEIGNTPSFTVLYLYDRATDPDHVFLNSIRARID